MRYLVTGATGFIGKKLALKLIDLNHEVVAVVRDPAKARDLEEAGITIFQGDITDKYSLRKPMTGCEGVFHVAGWYKVGVKDKSQAAAVNVEGSRAVFEMMRETGVVKGVYTSTLAINSDTHGKELDETFRFTGKHLSEYDRTKALAHQVAEEFIERGLPLTIVQPGMVYGPGDGGPAHNIWKGYLRRTLTTVPKRVAYSWGYVDDIVDGHILAMQQGEVGESYIICGPSATLVNALKTAEQYTGIKMPSQTSPGILKLMSSIMGIVESIASVPENYSSEYLRVAAGVTYLGDNAKARKEFGYNPRPLKAGIPPTLDWEMAQLGMVPRKAASAAPI